jgi:uncharacterized protein
MANRSAALVLLLLLASCGQGQRAQPELTTVIPPTAVAAPTAEGSVPAPPTDAVDPTATPAATYAALLVDISAPTAQPTVSHAPLVVSPIAVLTIPITIGAQEVTAELVTTPEQRQIGLMFREQMDANAGMLFVFPDEQPRSFWMRNTPLPLSIAFIDTDNIILNIEDMQPYDEQTFHMSRGAARYALEVNQGWFAQYGIKAGDRISFTLPPGIEIR